MVAKFSATLLLVLCILPMTAPFSAVGELSAMTGHHDVAAIGTSAAGTSVADDDVLVLERSRFLRQCQLCALVIDAHVIATSSSASSAPPLASSAFAEGAVTLHSILRL